jgi:hypothetical protein
MIASIELKIDDSKADVQDILDEEVNQYILLVLMKQRLMEQRLIMNV